MDSLPKFEYGFCPTNDNEDDRKNGHPAYQFTLVDTLSHLLPDFFQISYMDFFHQATVLFMSVCRGVPENKLKVRRGWAWGEGVSPSHTLEKKIKI